MKAVILRDRRDTFPMLDRERCFGLGREETTREDGARGANIFVFAPVEPDIIHQHEHTEETYWFTDRSGDVEMWLDGDIYRMHPGDRVIIPPGVSHAVRPTDCAGIRVHAEMVVISSPPHDSKNPDQINMAERPTLWYGG